MIGLIGVLVAPLLGAVILAFVSAYRLSARINIVVSAVAFASALLLLVERPAPGRYLQVDDLNVVFIVLGTFVGLTTSVFSASYIGHELATGRLTPAYLRFYHAMFQLMAFGMPCAPVAARLMPLSIARNPTTWLTALRRDTISSSPISTIDKATSAIPASIVGPMPTTGSISR